MVRERNCQREERWDKQQYPPPSSLVLFNQLKPQRMWKLSLFHLSAVLLQGMARRAGTGDNSSARCMARAARPQPLHPPWELRDKHPLPAHGSSRVPLCWGSLTYFSHRLLCIGRVQQLPNPKRSFCWTETTDHRSQDTKDCQSPLLYPNIITLHG